MFRKNCKTGFKLNVQFVKNQTIVIILSSANLLIIGKGIIKSVWLENMDLNHWIKNKGEKLLLQLYCKNT